MLGINDKKSIAKKMSYTHQKEFNEKSFQFLWIIWGAMLGPLFIYIIVCHLMKNEIQPVMDPNFPIDHIRYILGGVSLFTLMLTRFFRKRIISGRPDGPGPKPMEFQSLSDKPPLIAKYTAAMIVSLALSEFSGFIGLVLFFLGDNFEVLYIFMAIAAFGMFLNRPRRDEFYTFATAM
jgi:MFS family permease